MAPKLKTVDREVARIAAHQHGAVALRQLLAAGLSREAVKTRVTKGLLHREFRGVYRVGHRASSAEADYMAAVLACGERAALCRRSAACLYGLVNGRTRTPEVSAPTQRRIAGVITHHERRLDPRDLTRWHGSRSPPCPARSSTWLPSSPCDPSAEHATSPRFASRSRRRWSTRCLSGGHARPVPKSSTPSSTATSTSRSASSRGSSSGCCTRRTSPLPHTNRHVDDGYVDCRWPERGLTVELDSYRYHHTRHAWERDRRRERAAYARGDDFRRYTYGDLTNDRSKVNAEMCELLQAA